MYYEAVQFFLIVGSLVDGPSEHTPKLLSICIV